MLLRIENHILFHEYSWANIVEYGMGRMTHDARRVIRVSPLSSAALHSTAPGSHRHHVLLPLLIKYSTSHLRSFRTSHLVYTHMAQVLSLG